MTGAKAVFGPVAARCWSVRPAPSSRHRPRGAAVNAPDRYAADAAESAALIHMGAHEPTSAKCTRPCSDTIH